MKNEKLKNLYIIKRNNKTICFHVHDEYWGKVPDLSFIKDIEIHEDKHEKIDN